MVENHKKEEDDAQEVGKHGQLDVAYHPVQNLVWNKVSFESIRKACQNSLQEEGTAELVFKSGARTCKRGERDQYEPSPTATVQLVPGVWARELAIGLHSTSSTIKLYYTSSSTVKSRTPLIFLLHHQELLLHLACGVFHSVIHHSLAGKNNLGFTYWNRMC